MKLTDREWKSFTVEDLFTKIVPTKGETTGQLIIGDDVPYIAAAKNNNGFAGVYSCKEYSNWVSKGNCIVFVQLGDGAAGLAYYIPMDFIGMSGKTSCGYIDGKLNKYNGIFIAKILSANKAVFSHGHSWTGRRLLKTRIMLPASADGKPDFQFMEEYTKDLIEKKKVQYISYVKNIIKSFNTTINLNAVKWDSFIISEIFDIKPGKRLVAANSTEGTRPFIGALDNSNGVARFVSDDNVSKDKNVLGVNYNGNGMVIGFYHPYECIFSDDVKRFHLKHYPDNEYVLLFMKALILKQKSKFGYLYKFNADRMAHTSIMMPVDAEGNPDYAFMEQYGKMLVARKYKQYLDYLDGRKSI